MLDTIAELDPIWCDGTLFVNTVAGLSGSEQIERLHDIFMYCFKLRDFSETRFCAVRGVCAALCCCLCLGIANLVEIVRATKATDYHLHGFSLLSLAVRRYVVFAASACYVAETAQHAMLADGRLARTFDDVLQGMHDELDYLTSLGESTWTRLHRLIADPESTWQSVRSDILEAGHVQAGFVKKRVLDVLAGPPWCLARGDIRVNLLRFALSSPETLDKGCSLKIHILMDRKYPIEKLATAVAKLLDVTHDTNSTEQGHGSCAVLHRFRKYSSQRTLTLRAMIHQCRGMFWPCEHDKRMSGLQRQLAKLKRQSCKKTTGRNMFFSSLMKKVVKNHPAAKLPEKLKKSVMKQHVPLYKCLSFDQREVYANQADALDLASKAYIASEIERVQAQIDFDCA